jgi:hypothetical protein
MPRLSRFAEVDLGPMPAPKLAEPAKQTDPATVITPAGSPEPAEVAQAGQPETQPAHQSSGELAAGARTGGRRRRAEGETNDILARLLSSR